MNDEIKIAAFGISCLDYVCLIETQDANRNGKISTFKEVIGGLTGNAALAAKRLGATVNLVSVFGKDEIQKKVFTMLNQEEINTQFCQIIENRKSLFSFITIDKENGNRSIFSHKDNISDKEIEIDFTFLEETFALLLDIHWKETSLKVAKEAKDRNIPVIGDLRISSGNLDTLKYIDYPIVSIDYALTLTKNKDIKTALYLMKDAGAIYPIITAGEKGSYHIDNRGNLINIPTFKVNPIDTCGAGDVFHGAFAFAICKYDIRQALIFASATAALKCTRFGGGSGTPTFDEVMMFLKKYNI